MKKILITSLILFLMLISLVYANTLSQNDVLFSLDFNQVAGVYNDVSGHGNNATVGNQQPTSKTGDLFGDGYVNFDGNNQRLLIVDNNMIDWIGDAERDFSISIWFNSSSSATGEHFIMSKVDNSDGLTSRINLEYGVYGAGDLYGIIWTSGDSDEIRSWTGYNDNQWHNFVFVADRVTKNIITGYIDGNEFNYTANATDSHSTVAQGNLHIGGWQLDTYDFIGSIADFTAFNVSLTQEQVTDLYNGGAGLEYINFGGVNNNPIITWIMQEPLSLSTLNTQNTTFYYNVTDDFTTSNNVTCMLYEDKNLKDSDTLYSNGVYTLNVTNISEGYHYYNITCMDGLGLNSSTSTKYLQFDYTTPVLDVFSPKIDNTTVFYDTLNISFYIEDLNLARYVVNVTNSTGDLIYSELTNITPTNHTINLLLNTTTWNNGVFDIQIGVADE